jgi:hypothetical protein
MRPKECTPLEAVLLVSRGIPVQIGQCHLFPDQDVDLIWGVDAYGCDVVAGNTCGPEGVRNAIAWAVRQASMLLGEHPAEKGAYAHLH